MIIVESTLPLKQHKNTISISIDIQVILNSTVIQVSLIQIRYVTVYWLAQTLLGVALNEEAS